jgi:hypothetical protein
MMPETGNILEIMMAERSCERLVYRYAWLCRQRRRSRSPICSPTTALGRRGDGEPMRNREGIRRVRRRARPSCGASRFT